MICEEPVDKNVPVKQGMAPGSAGKYKEVPIKYNYGPEGQLMLDELYMEWPELYSATGLTEKTGLSGRPEFSIMVSIPTTGETGRLITALNGLHHTCAEFIFKVKGKLGFPMFQVAMAEGMGFKNPLHQARDKTTGELLGRNPSMFLKCFDRGIEKTLFHRPCKKMNRQTGQVECGPDGTPLPAYEPMDWKLLKDGASIKFIPLVHIKKIYVGGGKCALQMELKSAIITNVIQRGTESMQMDTIETLTREDSKIVDNLDEQIAKLMALKQDVLARNPNPAGASGYPPGNHGTMETLGGGAPGTNSGMQQYADPAPQQTIAEFTASTPTPGSVAMPRPVAAPGLTSLTVKPRQIG